MTSLPLVSIIIPCYNQGKYIEETLDSVRNQTYKNIETIIINDGSTDEFTNLKIDEISKKYPSIIIINKLNGGLAAARNTGVRAANGQYIFPLDSDDIIKPTFIERCLQVIENEANVVAVCSYMQNFGTINKLYKPKGGTLHDFLIYNRATSSILYRKDDWEKIGGYDESNRLGYQDWQFCIELLKSGGKIYSIPEPLFLYRRSQNSMVTNSDKNRKAIVTYIMNKNPEIFLDYFSSTIAEWNLRDLSRNISIFEGFKIFINSVLKSYNIKK